MISGVYYVLGCLHSFRSAGGRGVRSQQIWGHNGEIDAVRWDAVITILYFLHWNGRVLLWEYSNAKLVEQEAFWDLECPAAETLRRLIKTVLWPSHVLRSNSFQPIKLWFYFSLPITCMLLKLLTYFGKMGSRILRQMPSMSHDRARMRSLLNLHVFTGCEGKFLEAP